MPKKDTSKLRVKYALFCDYALISQDGKFSLIGEFDRLYSSGETAVLNRGFLVAKLLGAPNDDLNLTVALVKDKGSSEPLFKNDFNLKLDDRGSAALMIEVSGMQFKEFGLYKAVIKNGKETVVEVDLDVSKINPQTPARA